MSARTLEPRGQQRGRRMRKIRESIYLAIFLCSMAPSAMADGLFSDDPSPAEMTAYGKQAEAAKNALKLLEQYSQVILVQQMQSGNCDPAFEIETKASAGDVSSQLLYGRLHAEGLCVPKDQNKFIEWITKAADQGNAEANRTLGLAYETGFGVAANQALAAAFMAKAANAGDIEAETKYGSYILEGKGVPQNPSLAVEWFQRAASKGDDEAGIQLGALYVQGELIPRDLNEAAKWLYPVAEKGNQRAQLILGLTLLQQNKNVEAHKWVNLASASPDPQLAELATKNRIELEKAMPRADVEKARKLASEWQPKSPSVDNTGAPEIVLPAYPPKLASKIDSKKALSELKRLKVPVEKEAFLASIRTNNLGIFTLFHVAGASLETVFWPGGLRPLYLAVDYGADDVFDYLIANGANINAHGIDNGMSALTRAFAHDRPRMIEALLDNGATAAQPPEWKGREDLDPLAGGTPLRYAATAETPNLTLIKRLLAAGASTSETFYGGTTVLHEVKNGEVFTLLVANGADPNAIDDLRESVLWKIVKEDNVDIALLTTALASGANADGPPDQASPLLLMAWRGNAEAVQALVNSGAMADFSYHLRNEVIPGNWDETDQDIVTSGGTPLILAAKKGHAAVSRILVRAGANPRTAIVISGKNVSAMSLAEQSGNPLLISAMKQ